MFFDDFYYAWSFFKSIEADLYRQEVGMGLKFVWEIRIAGKAHRIFFGGDNDTLIAFECLEA